MESFRVTTEQRDDQVHLAVSGELDLASAPRIEEALRGVEEQSPAVVVLDLRGLEFMDSTGLRTILAADARAKEAGRRLVVVEGDENIRRVFEVTRLYDRVEIVRDPAEIDSAGG
jgi:anti-sigma B factor antagonist